MFLWLKNVFKSSGGALEHKEQSLPNAMMEISDVIGVEAAMKLWKAYAGRQIYVPALSPLLKDSRERDMEIVRRHKNGETIPDLAEEYKVTERWIYKVLARRRRA